MLETARDKVSGVAFSLLSACSLGMLEPVARLLLLPDQGRGDLSLSNSLRLFRQAVVSSGPAGPSISSDERVQASQLLRSTSDRSSG